MSDPVIRSIPLDRLELSPANVRRTEAGRTAFADTRGHGDDRIRRHRAEIAPVPLWNGLKRPRELPSRTPAEAKRTTRRMRFGGVGNGDEGRGNHRRGAHPDGLRTAGGQRRSARSRLLPGTHHGHAGPHGRPDRSRVTGRARALSGDTCRKVRAGTLSQSAAANPGQSRYRLASILSETRRAASCTESRARCAYRAVVCTWL